MRSVIAVGLGVATPQAQSVDVFEQILRAGHPAFHCECFSPSDPCIVASLLKATPDWLPYLQTLDNNAPQRKLVHALKRTSLSLQWAAAVGLQAWAHAGLTTKDGTKTSLYIAGNNLDAQQTFQAVEKYQKTPTFLKPTHAFTHYDTDYLGTISELLQISGEGHVLGTTSASGNSALIQAYRAIRHGETDRCLIVAPFTTLSPVEIRAFRALGALGGKSFTATPNAASRPFDADHEGFIFSQNCAAVVLEEASVAQQRNATAYGRILGGATRLSGNRLTDPDQATEIAAMQHALSSAQLPPASVDLINTHGSATPLGDATELDAIATLFADHLSHIRLQATKAITGHSLHAAGLLEAIATWLQMRAGFLHPQTNLTTPIRDGLLFASADDCEPFSGQIALNNAFAFGGIHTCSVLGGIAA